MGLNLGVLLNVGKRSKNWCGAKPWCIAERGETHSKNWCVAKPWCVARIQLDMCNYYTPEGVLLLHTIMCKMYTPMECNLTNYTPFLCIINILFGVYFACLQKYKLLQARILSLVDR